ncbi:hypothetical protein PanWU01x14_352220, partial [Parasponia andersonii]
LGSIGAFTGLQPSSLVSPNKSIVYFLCDMEISLLLLATFIPRKYLGVPRSLISNSLAISFNLLKIITGEYYVVYIYNQNCDFLVRRLFNKESMISLSLQVSMTLDYPRKSLEPSPW